MDYSTYCRPFCGRLSQQKKTKIMKMKTIGVKLLVIFGLLFIPTAMHSGNNYSTLHKTFYLNRYWDEKTQQVVTETVEKKVQKLNRFHVLFDKELGDTGEERWYILDREYPILGIVEMKIKGKVHIILEDGKTLEVDGGIHLEGGNELHFYSQSDGENQGKVVIKAWDTKPGIGNFYRGKTGNLYIHGGDFDITGGCDGGAGIGSAASHDFDLLDGFHLGKVYVYGGTMKVHGGKGGGSGIGGGSKRHASSYDGHYYQYGGEVTVWGAELAAGIGGGGGYHPVLPNTMAVGGAGIEVNVYGGKLTAYGGRRGAGIGSGSGNAAGGLDGGKLYMYGGTVYAKGGDYGAGVGGGCSCWGGDSYLYGGSLTAIGGKDATGIGGGEDGAGFTCIVDGATVRAVGSGPAAGIGGGKNKSASKFEYKSGTVVAIAGGDCSAREQKGGSAIGCGKKDKYKYRFWTTNVINLSETCKVTGGDSEDNIERTFNRWEREAACRWRNYVKLETCTHENAVFTYINEVRHHRECKNCDYAYEEKHTVEIGKDCPCGKKYNADTDTWLVTVVETADGKTYAAGKEQRIVRGRDFALPKAERNLEGLIFMGYVEATTAPASLEMQDSEFTSLLREGTIVTPKDNCTYYARYRYVYNEEWTWSDDLSAATVKISNSLLNDSRTLNATVTEITEERVEPVGTAMGMISYQAEASIERAPGVKYEFNNYTRTEFFNTAHVELDAEASNNEEILEPYNDHIGSVSIDNLTFKKDGKLHPLCLPVSLTKEEIDAGPLAGATFYQLAETKLEGNQLQVSFKKITEDYIVAGEPYYVKWASGSNVQNPEFNYAHFNSNTPSSLSDSCFTHVGTYDKAAIEENVLKSGDFLTLSDDEKLVDLPNDMVDAFSNYMYIPHSLAEDGTTAIRSVRISFEDDITVEKTLSHGYDGKGTQESPYMIMTASQLKSMSIYFNNGDEGINGKYFKQGANIEFDKTVKNNFTPVKNFIGQYDGDGYVINGLNISLDDPNSAALFGAVKENSMIKNVIIKNSTFSGSDAAAVADAVYDNAGVDNCHVLKDVTVSGSHSAGGVVGFINGSSSARVTGCTSQATVNGYSGVGVVVGHLTMGYVGSCIALSSNVKATSQSNAVVGFRQSGMVENCYYTAPTLSDPRAKLMPNVTEDNTDFLTKLHARDQFLQDGNSGLREDDICYNLTINGREYKATQQTDGTWKSVAYTISLPFDVDIPEEKQEDVRTYYLHEIDTENKEFIFFDDFPILKAGDAYIIVIKKESFTFTGKNILVKTEPKEPLLVRNNHRNKELGDWCANFKKLTNEELVDKKAYVIQKNGTFRLYEKVYASRPYVNPFRAYFSALEPIGSTFKMKFEETENGEETGDVTDFPADEFDSDCDIEEGTGIYTMSDVSSKMEDVQFYDLQGRKLGGKPNKGVYIQNGKKIIIK